MLNITQSINNAKLQLPKVPPPAGAYIPVKQSAGLLFISGQLPMLNGKIIYQGKVGKDISIEDGQKAAQICALNILAQANAYIENNNCSISEIIKLGGFVNSLPDFTEQPAIINGASNLMLDLFQDKGQHARFAVSAPSLPLNAAVEIEAIIALNQ